MAQAGPGAESGVLEGWWLYLFRPLRYSHARRRELLCSRHGVRDLPAPPTVGVEWSALVST